MEVMKTEVLASRKIHTDDTTVPVLDKTRSRRSGRLWVMLAMAPTSTSSSIHAGSQPRRPVAVPPRVQGYLQADAYAGYDALYAGGEVIEVACWLMRAASSSMREEHAARAQIALAHIRELYAIEKRGRDLGEVQRRDLRVVEGKPLLDAFKSWLDDEAQKVLPKSPIGEAIHYARAQWVGLTRYLEDGVLELDNNRAERALRLVGGRTEELDVRRSDEGGRRAAHRLQSHRHCAALKIDPYAYLRM